MRLPYLVDAFEGCALTLDTNGKTALAGKADNTVYLNFTPAGRSDAATSQKDPFRDDGSNITIETGGLTGIMGTGFEVGVPNTATFWLNATLPTTSDVGKHVVVSDATDTTNKGKFDYVIVDTTNAGAGTSVSRGSIGNITRVENGIVYFTFRSAVVPIYTTL
jgi:hypothetical protein